VSRPTDAGTAALADAVAAAGLDPGGRGVPATDLEYRYEPDRTVGLLAGALARLHAVAVPADGPRLTPADVVSLARDRLAVGRITPDTVDAAYTHVDPTRLVDVLAEGSHRLADAPAVITHGSATLDALRCEAGAALGLAGTECLAVADPYRDLAVAARSIATTFGPMLVPELFERYGGPPADPVRLDWWALATVLTTDPVDGP
jgi:aminoglycoside 3'-phosphotransferase-2